MCVEKWRCGFIWVGIILLIYWFWVRLCWHELAQGLH